MKQSLFNAGCYSDGNGGRFCDLVHQTLWKPTLMEKLRLLMPGALVVVNVRQIPEPVKLDVEVGHNGYVA